MYYCTIPVNEIHHTVYPLVNSRIANSTCSQTLRPHIQNPKIHRNPLHLLNQYRRQAYKSWRGIMDKDTIILMEQPLIQRIKKEEKDAGTIIQQHPERLSVSTRNDRHTHNLDTIQPLTPLFKQRITFMKPTLRIIRNSGQYGQLIPTFRQFKGHIIASEGFWIKMIGQQQATHSQNFLHTILFTTPV